MADGDLGELGPLIVLLQSLKMGGAESQISTQESVSIRNRVTLPLYQAGGIALGFVLALGGLGLMTWGVSWLLELDWDVRSYLLAWIGLLLLGVGVAALVRRFLATQAQAVQAFAAVAAALVVGLAVGSLLLTVREKFGVELGAMVVGAGLTLGSVAFLYNQVKDIISGGYWRRSPFEEEISKRLIPAVEVLMSRGMAQAGPDARVEDPRPMARRLPSGTVVAADEPEDEEEGPGELVTINPEAGNLIWFIRFAARLRTLSLADLTVRPAPLLPFPEGDATRLNRTMIRRLVARGSTEDEVTVDGHKERGLGAGGLWQLRGAGTEPAWLVERVEAQRRADRMWQNIYGDAVPVPDYWDEMRQAA